MRVSLDCPIIFLGYLIIFTRYSNKSFVSLSAGATPGEIVRGRRNLGVQGAAPPGGQGAS